MAPRVSLKDVAREAGVSISTVSQCLLNKPGPNKETAAKIRALAARMGYRPNPLLASLASRQFHPAARHAEIPLAMVLHSSREGGYMEDMTVDVRYQYVKDNATALGYKFHCWRYDRITNVRTFHRELYHRGVQGMIVCLQSAPDLSLFEQGDWERFSLVINSNDPRLERFHLASGHSFEAVRLVWYRLKQLGYRRIGWALLQHTPQHYDDFQRSSCVRQILEQTPLEDRIQPLLHTSIMDRESFLIWYRQHRPQVVVGFHFGQLFWLKEAGIQVPEETAFCCLHVQEADAIQYPGLAGVYNMDAAVCRASVSLLDQLIRHRSLGLIREPCRILVNPRWRDGSFCPPLLTSTCQG